MSLKAELETWAAALKAYDEQDFDTALSCFERIGDTSKICWNMGIILATLGRHEEAVEKFIEATSLDGYLTVAYHQAGVSNFMLGRYEAAHKDFEDALLYMRGNQTINYEQLGLNFRLYSAEVLFNCGLAKIYMGQVDSGIQDMRDAASQKQSPEHGVIDDAIRDQGRDYNVFSVPVGVLFKPAPGKLKNLAARDYMGKAVLVAASDVNDAYTTFTGVTRLQRGQTPSGAPLDPNHPLSRSASVGALDSPLPIATRMTRSNTIATSAGNIDPPRPLARNNTTLNTTPNTIGLRNMTTSTTPDIQDMRGLSRGNSIRPSDNNSLSTPSKPRTERKDSTSSSEGPNSPPDPVLRTPQERQKSLRVTELYDDYYKSPGAYEDDIPPELPPIGGRKIEAWAKKTIAGAPLTRNNSASARGPPSSFGGKGLGLRRTPSTMSSVMTMSRYEEDGVSENGSFYDMVKIRVKVHVGSLTRGMSISPTDNFPDFLDAIRAKFPDLTSDVGVRFRDEDGDMLSMQDEGDFEAAIDVARVMAKGRQEGKLEIWVD
ncbi:hypothetical protein M231_04434 [Tremella mesenterica]|uniref:PB1 domain-containing protein n=1 Tax=Tremella mesenterica TaxID=5217 RepID=A0A4Q1BKF1_TREME|nr:uncharacterized protein TREMEDRAFT_68118 [Tremella mesenterica DSM 1558]EIW70575.1 hypothetical protein TREMEDRAFT_68118 [Tremella mesenterica DSM 1558]RXK38261.1 hypothetical protein M231_04434 [Tremella mesenterica]